MGRHRDQNQSIYQKCKRTLILVKAETLCRLLAPVVTQNQTLDDGSPKDEISIVSSERISISSNDEDGQKASIELSRLSIASEMVEMMLDEGIDSQADFLPRFQSINVSTENRRRIVKCCLDLKRLMDKDTNPILADSTIQKSLFSKTNPNVTVLFRCLKVLDVLIKGIFRC